MIKENLNSENGQKYKIFDGDTFEFRRKFFNRKQAKLRGEELKLNGDIERYRVERKDQGKFVLWIH